MRLALLLLLPTVLVACAATAEEEDVEGDTAAVSRSLDDAIPSRANRASSPAVTVRFSQELPVRDYREPNRSGGSTFSSKTAHDYSNGVREYASALGWVQDIWLDDARVQCAVTFHERVSAVKQGARFKIQGAWTVQEGDTLRALLPLCEESDARCIPHRWLELSDAEGKAERDRFIFMDPTEAAKIRPPDRGTSVGVIECMTRSASPRISFANVRDAFGSFASFALR